MLHPFWLMSLLRTSAPFADELGRCAGGLSLVDSAEIDGDCPAWAPPQQAIASIASPSPVRVWAPADAVGTDLHL